MERTEEIALTQMRKSIEKLGFSTVVWVLLYLSFTQGSRICIIHSGCLLYRLLFWQKYGESTLMRFLIARSMNPDKAAKMFVKWLQWRASFVPNGFIADSEVLDELEVRKLYLQGLSKNKYPLGIIKASKHFPSKDHQQFKSKWSSSSLLHFTFYSLNFSFKILRPLYL